MKIYFLAIIALSFSCLAFANDKEIPSAMQPAIRRAFEASSPFGPAIESVKVGRRQAAFRDALTQIAMECDGKTAEICRIWEGDSMEYKIVSIAVDLKDHPERYKEIEQTYLHAPLPPVGDISIGPPKFPRPKASHLDEAYRLVWEFMMLRPEQNQINYRSLGDLQENVVLSALKTINSIKSQVLYEYCFTEAARADILGREWTSDVSPWISLLDAMALQQTPQCIRRMLRCSDSLKANPKYYGKVRQLIVGLLIGLNSQWVELYFGGTAPKEHPNYLAFRTMRENWASAIKQIPAEGLSREHQAILREALESPHY
ncbi:MAG: hypothetical protein V4710_00440 [Verrucomicrobiota bacterium]